MHCFKDMGIWFFCRIGLKCLSAAQNFGFWGEFGPQNVIGYHRNPKRHISAINIGYEHWSYNSVHICNMHRRDDRIRLFVSCVRKKTKTSPICPSKMGGPISVTFCTKTPLSDIPSGRFLNIFSLFIFTGGSNFVLLHRLRLSLLTQRSACTTMHTRDYY